MYVRRIIKGRFLKMAVTWKKLAYEDDVVENSLFDADTFLYATNNDTPVATSPANVMAALSGHAGADFAMNSHKFTGLSVPANAGDSIRATAKITKHCLEVLQT